MADEEWRPVVGFENLYEVSNAGRVKRIGKAAVSGKGRGGGARIGRILAICKHRAADLNPYSCVNLWRDGKNHRRLLHVLVAAAFVGPAPTSHEVNHEDGIKPNCRSGNLEYLTRGDNNRHAYRTGLRQPSNRKLTNETAALLREEHEGGMGYRRLAQQFGISKSTVRAVIARKTYALERIANAGV
jgi:hypothetical protein